MLLGNAVWVMMRAGRRRECRRASRNRLRVRNLISTGVDRCESEQASLCASINK
jgi:hypothetical protein